MVYIFASYSRSIKMFLGKSWLGAEYGKFFPFPAMDGAFGMNVINVFYYLQNQGNSSMFHISSAGRLDLYILFVLHRLMNSSWDFGYVENIIADLISELFNAVNC